MAEEKPIVSYQLEQGVATIRMQDGGKNLISPSMLKALHQAFDRAEQDNAVVILTGSEEVFSAGFDLAVLKTGVGNAYRMLTGGFVLMRRLLAFPRPIVVACNGHSIAMGLFLTLTGDYRIGVEGPYKIVANEVAIGLTLPHSAIEICRQRLQPAQFYRATLLAETFNPSDAVSGGFLDEVVAAKALPARAKELASSYLSLDKTAHQQSKLRLRKQQLRDIDRAITADRLVFAKLVLQRLLRR